MVDQNTNNNNISDSTNNENNSVDNEPKYILDLSVSVNKLKAYLRVKILDQSAVVSESDILERIKEENITYGVKSDDIKEYCKNKQYFKELTVAEGKAPVKGEDAYIKYNFDTSEDVRFTENANGTVDFKNINNIKTVQKDGLLCTKIEPKEGTAGSDVFGNLIPCGSVRDISLPNGKNTYVSEDGLKLYASVEGCIHKKSNGIDIDNVYTVNSVDQSTGNIDFVGSVIVKGDVKAGFTLKANSDITVKGMVEGAILISGGNVTISNGMNGRNTGRIEAEGDVTSKYLENCEVISKKNVFSGAIINSNVTASKSIILRGERATIIGGECKSGEIISAKTIGTKNNISTKLSIDLEQYNDQSKNGDKKLIEINTLIEDKDKSIRDLEQKIQLLLPYIKKSPENERIYKLAILQKLEMNKELGQLKAKKLEFINNNKKIELYKVVCSGIIYANTRINIGWLKYIVREDLSYSKLYNNGSDIQISPLLPSDVNPEV